MLGLETAKSIYRRYISFKIDAIEDYIEFLLKNNQLEEALSLYI